MPSTLWSTILAAADPAHPDRRAALERLAHAYWRPVYAMVRGMGAKPDDAADLTQEFFARLLEKKKLAAVDPARGRFRAFLKTAVRNFLANEWERRGALKRGGAVRTLSLDVEEAERLLEPAVHDDPARGFDRQWAMELLQAAIQQLEAEMRGPLFDAVRGAFSLTDPELPTHARIAASLHVSEQDVANFLFRARRRLRDILRERVLDSVEDAADVDDEIRDLFDSMKDPIPPPL